MKKWHIYEYGELVGVCDKVNNVFSHIEALEGRKLAGWEISPLEVKIGDYIAKREETKP